ncbi:MAG: hypothetical protein F4Z33_08605 [Gemmatimonadales bacterium]|nr:hypothetical protein [Gemmatimonadales bacterium]
MRDRKMDGVRGILVGGFCAFAAGCGEGVTPPEPPPEPLNTPLAAHEAVAMFDGLAAVLRDSTAPVMRIVGDTVVSGCPLAGRVTRWTRATAEQVGDTIRFAIDQTAVPDGCRLSHAGLPFTVDGPPSGIRDQTTANLVTVANGLDFLITGEIVGTLRGRLDWRLDHRFGSCDIDLTLSGGEDLSSETQLFLVGTLCGHEVRLEVESELLLTEPPEAMRAPHFHGFMNGDRRQG